MTKPAPPESPPPLTKLPDRLTSLAAARGTAFDALRLALAAHRGAVTRAAVSMFPDMPKGAARNKVNTLVRRLGLADYAADLRQRATGRRGAGRPKANARRR